MQNSFSSHSLMQGFLHPLLKFLAIITARCRTWIRCTMTQRHIHMVIIMFQWLWHLFLLPSQAEGISTWCSFCVLTAIQKHVAMFLNQIPKTQPVSRVPPLQVWALWFQKWTLKGFSCNLLEFPGLALIPESWFKCCFLQSFLTH